MSDKKDKFLVLRVPAIVKDKLVAIAKDRGISISKVVREILTKALRD